MWAIRLSAGRFADGTGHGRLPAAQLHPHHIVCGKAVLFNALRNESASQFARSIAIPGPSGPCFSNACVTGRDSHAARRGLRVLHKRGSRIERQV